MAAGFSQTKTARGFEKEEWVSLHNVASEELLTQKRDISGENSYVNVWSLNFGLKAMVQAEHAQTTYLYTYAP